MAQDSMVSRIRCVELKRSESHGFGFSILGGSGSELPPIVYDIVDNSPASMCGQLEAGDVILEVNNQQVNNLTTKEVLKCLRLSQGTVNLKLQRDGAIKEKVREYLYSSNNIDALRNAITQQDLHRVKDIVAMKSPAKSKNSSALTSVNSASSNIPKPAVPIMHSPPRGKRKPLPPPGKLGEEDKKKGRLMYGGDGSNEDFTRNEQDLFGNGHGSNGHGERPRFEAFTMTGDMILNLSSKSQYSLPAGKVVHSPPGKGRSLKPENPFPPPGKICLEVKHPTDEFVPELPHGIEDVTFSNRFEEFSGNIGTPLENSKDGGGSAPTSPLDSDDTISAPKMRARDDSTSRASTKQKFRASKSEDQLLEEDEALSAFEDTGGSYNTLLDTSEKHIDASISIVQSELETNDKQTNTKSSDNSVDESHAKTNVESRRITVNSGEQLSASDNRVVSESPASEAVATSERDTRAIWTVNAPKDSVPPEQFDFSHINGGSGGHKTSKSQLHQSQQQEQLSSTANADQLHLRLSNASATQSPQQQQSPTSPESEEGSDVESLHSFHFSPKAVDLPSAVRLAKRLYSLDGFKKSDVSRHLSKNNEFNRTVADEYLRYFNFENQSLDVALRAFLDKFALTGETQERERVLVHFSRRYVLNNPGSFNSPDACHTLTCALMLLNTDLHVQHVPRKMTGAEFIDNLSELNDGDDFPRDTLKALYAAIKNTPLHYATDDEYEEMAAVPEPAVAGAGAANPFLEVPDASKATEYKRGYIMRKCCVEPNGKRTPLGKRAWRMFYCTLRDLILYLHKDENSSRKPAAFDDLHNAIRVHHALATKAEDYVKKQHVFRLQTADRAEYLLQTSDAKELQSWVDAVNFCAASLSAPQLPEPVGSQRRFQRPLLPAAVTKLNLHDQLVEHERKVAQTEAEISAMEENPPAKAAKSQVVHNYKEKYAFLKAEAIRYRTYTQLLRTKMSQFSQTEPSAVLQTTTPIGELDEDATAAPLPARTGTAASEPTAKSQGRPVRATESDETPRSDVPTSAESGPTTANIEMPNEAADCAPPAPVTKEQLLTQKISKTALAAPEQRSVTVTTGDENGDANSWSPPEPGNGVDPGEKVKTDGHGHADNKSQEHTDSGTFTGKKKKKGWFGSSKK